VPAARIKTAYDDVLSGGRPEERTRDIGGTATTDQFTEALLKRL
jgi:isocitrate/isopropylmalate dehydrogenase